MRIRRLPTMLVALLALSGTDVLAREATAEDPPSSCARHRELDFWVGDWRVLDPEGVEIGTDRVERRLGGCVIQESWTSRQGGTGFGISYFDPALANWRQDWVDSRGNVVHYEGTYRDGGMDFDGEAVRPDGRVILARARLEPRPAGRVSYRMEHSTDGGATWNLYFDGLYEPLTARAAAAPATPAPAPPAGIEVPDPPAAEAPGVPATATRPPPAGGVKAVSVASPEEIPEEELPQIRMESPMTLEVDLGRIDLLPEGQAWFNDEIDAYLCNDVTLRRIEAARRSRRRGIELALSFAIHSRRIRQKVDLDFEILSGEKVVVSRQLPKLPVGRLVTTFDTERGVVHGTTIEMTAEELAGLFAGDGRPRLRVTLTVP